jgi:protein-S-isoprenylcysteine O-methyltransferase Ste14
LWIVASLIPKAISLYFLAIKKEEIYLEKKFGKGYLDYKNKVRRWL